jgi:hypothetical protein
VIFFDKMTLHHPNLPFLLLDGNLKASAVIARASQADWAAVWSFSQHEQK